MLFDLDGTVWDSEAGIVGCVVHTLERLGLPVPDDQVLASNVGPPLEQMLAESGVPAGSIELGVSHYREHYIGWGAFQATVYPGMARLLADLGVEGRRLATATSKGETPTQVMLDHFGLRPHFEVVGAASMDGSATTKELVIGRALAGLGDPDPARCVLVGDRHYDVAGAAAHGIDCIGVSWGYSSEGELDDAGADLVVHSVPELRAALSERGAP